MYSHHSEKGTNTATRPKHRLHDVLLEVDGWRLVRPLYPNLVDTNSYIIHWECSGVKMPQSPTLPWINKGDKGATGGIGVGNKCSKCDAKCPDEIAGLYILHNGGI